MKKLIRFSILAVLFIAMFILLFSVIPTITWIFGGSFTSVSTHPCYITFATTFIVIGLGVLFGESFDENFYSKK